MVSKSIEQLNGRINERHLSYTEVARPKPCNWNLVSILFRLPRKYRNKYKIGIQLIVLSFIEDNVLCKSLFKYSPL